MPSGHEGEQDWDGCADALGISKVALMFLTRGEMPHEEMWSVWLQSAAGKLPSEALAERACAKGALTMPSACVPAANVATIRAQHLFNVYVHSAPSFAGFPNSSIFHGYELKERTQVEWGSHSLATATKLLLAAALKNPLNQAFVLLSESDIPLYPPSTIYMQLLREEKSRISACKMHWTRDPPGWAWDKGLGEHWRKSSQWFAMHRDLAAAVVNDTQIDAAFRDNCFANEQQHCYSDENYFGTLLSYLGFEDRTDCVGYVSHANWDEEAQRTGHPSAYRPGDVTPERLRGMRGDPAKCHDNAAIQSSKVQLVSILAASSDVCRRPRAPAHDPRLLPSADCPLLSRKFPPDTVWAVLGVVQGSCSNGLHIVDRQRCNTWGEGTHQA